MPFILQHELGLTAAQYGSVMVIPSAGLLVGTLALNVLNRYVSSRKILALAICIIVASGMWLTVTELTLFNIIWALLGWWLLKAYLFQFLLLCCSATQKASWGGFSVNGSNPNVLSWIIGGYLVETWIQSSVALGAFYLVCAGAMGIALYTSRLTAVTRREFA